MCGKNTKKWKWKRIIEKINAWPLWRYGWNFVLLQAIEKQNLKEFIREFG